MSRAIANVIGLDDAPFSRGDATAPLVGTVYARDRLDGVLVGAITPDGDDATDAVVTLLRSSRFDGHVSAVLLQGIAFGGFNVVDAPSLASRLERPVIVVARKAPNLERMHAALAQVPGSADKRARLDAAGPMRPMGGVFAQVFGTDDGTAAATLALHTRHGVLPEPLRVAHLLGAALVLGHSHGGA
ncbi:MAG: DUF99 family protein [Sandaracinus sp.]|nr:DUF99 family protein [Sandaracinus sp.]MCB9611226.1 DUF99 family protein [Sandaracinus sp.]MCB9630847.1 DUF99 family protein [Sandaracinus sp.]